MRSHSIAFIWLVAACSPDEQVATIASGDTTVRPRMALQPCTQVASKKLWWFEKTGLDKFLDTMDLGRNHKATLSLVKGAIWDHNNLSVAFVEDVSSLRMRTWVKTIAREWEQGTGVYFDFVDGENADIRITFGGNGNMSRIGTAARDEAPGQPTLWLGGLGTASPYREVRQVVLHELGHALGAPHEHQTPLAQIHWRRAVVLQYYREAFGWDEAKVEENVFHQYGSNEVMQAQFDKDSIMTYPIRADWNEEGLEIPLKENLSTMDRDFVREVYSHH